MAQYTRTTIVDANPGGDTVKQAVLDLDTDLTGLTTAYNASEANKYVHHTWVLEYPSVGGLGGVRLKHAQTAVRLDGFCVGGTSVAFNIEERSTIGSAGTNIIEDDMVADTNGESTTSFSNSGLAADSWLWLDISAVTGSVTQVVITLACSVG